jgi:hypothetical protein
MTETKAELVAGNPADAALLGLVNELVDSIAAARYLDLAARHPLPAPPRDPPRSREWRHLGPRARSMAEGANPDLPATPDRPGKHYCDICGCADPEQIEPGPDKDTFGADDCAWMCTDANARACEARKLHRYPPRPDLVPEAMLSAVDADDAARAARQQAQQQAVSAQAAARQQWHPPGWQVTGNGSWDEFGTWRPNLPPAQPPVPPAPVVHSAYAHTLMNPHNRAHLLSGQQRPHYYGGHPGYIPPGMAEGAEPAAGAPGGQQVTPGPEGPQQTPGARLEGGDVPLGQTGQMPVRPGRQWQSPLPEHGPKLKQPAPRRRGRKLTYSPGKPARRGHPGVSGSEGFHGGGAGDVAGGPGGGSSET